MADLDKNIIITPNVGQSAAPNIRFLAANSSVNAQTITMTALTANDGTLMFSGNSGNLFSISSAVGINGNVLTVVGSTNITGNLYSSNVYITGTGNGITFADGTVQTTAGSSVANTVYLQGGLNTANANTVYLQAVNNAQNANIISVQTLANTDYTTLTASAGVYGNSTFVPVVTLAANGRITSITNTAITVAPTTAFSRVIISGQPDAIANIANSPLTLVAGSGMTITTVGTSNTITFATTGGFSGGTITNQLIVANSTPSISNGTGALIVQGGVGVSGNVYIGASGVLGFANAASISVVYQVYNAANNSLDTIFG